MHSSEERSAVESPETTSDQDGRAVRAAVAYYVEKKTMDAVARELETSRATVSRLLAQCP